MDKTWLIKALAEKATNVHKIRHYAVLIPLIEIEDKWHIVYEVRSEEISQGGEVSFPGGRIEEGETGWLSAVRETNEELGIDFLDIIYLGESDYYENESIRISCYVGYLKNNDWKNYPYSKTEVKELFTVPVETLTFSEPKTYYLKGHIDEALNPDFPFSLIKGGKEYNWRGMNREVLFYELGEKYPLIWGVTACLTYSFIKKIKKFIKKA